MLKFPELSSQLLEKMLLSAKILWHNAKHIDISIETVGLKPKTSENFHPIAYLLEIDELVLS